MQPFKMYKIPIPVKVIVLCGHSYVRLVWLQVTSLYFVFIAHTGPPVVCGQFAFRSNVAVKQGQQNVFQYTVLNDLGLGCEQIILLLSTYFYRWKSIFSPFGSTLRSVYGQS